MSMRLIRGRFQGLGHLRHLGVSWVMTQDIAEKRIRALRFWQEHGIDAAIDAFSVSRRTLYRWKSRLGRCKGKLTSLNPQSTAPKKRRRRKWPAEVVSEIGRLRVKEPNLGKDKIYPLLKPWCEVRGIPCPSVSTIGRIIGDAPDKMRLVPQRIDRLGRVKAKRKRKPRKPKGTKACSPGQWVAVDTIERFCDGQRRYLITLTDAASSMSLAIATNSHTSSTAARFLDLSLDVLPFAVTTVLSDNGSEFQGAFDKKAAEAGIKRWYTYPRCPKMNAQAERFNRTIQEKFVDYNEDLLFTDLQAFNQKLFDWMLWFNAERPHWSHGQRPPLQYVAEHTDQCQMSWTHTNS